MAGVIPEENELLAICYTKAAWLDDWTEEPYLECISLSDVAAPGHASAQFTWNYGTGLMYAVGSKVADTDYQTYPRLDLNDHYIKVVTSEGWTWHGYVTDRDDDRLGKPEGLDELGAETFTAYGLSILLDLMQSIRSSVIDDTGTRIGMAIPFNGGNMSTATRQRASVANKATDGLYFRDRITGANEMWQAVDAVNYLFEHFLPTNSAGNVLIPFELNNTAGLDFDLPLFPYEGQSFWQILNSLVSSQRGLGLNLTVTENDFPADDVVNVNIWSYSPDAIPLPGGGEIPANTNQVSFDLSAEVNIDSEVVTESAVDQFDQVLVYGSYRGAVCTLLPEDGENTVMIHAASASEITDYNEARKDDTDFSGLSNEEKAARNAHYRSLDKLRKVFSWWNLDNDWDLTLGGELVFPVIDAAGELSTEDSIPVWIAGLKIADFIPMRTGVDYTGAVTPATDDSDTDESDFLPPAVWFDMRQAERMDVAADSDSEAPAWSVQTRVKGNWPGLIFEVNGGQQHYIADDLYISNGSYEDIPSEVSPLDHGNWRATVYMTSQLRVFAKYPADADVVAGDVKRVYELDVPDAYLDYLVPGTTVGVDYAADGSQSYATTDGGFLRDDRQRLQDIARLIWSWKGQTRKILSLSYTSIKPYPPVGYLITDIGPPGSPEIINTVVTSISMNLRTGITQIRTQASELDAGQFL